MGKHTTIIDGTKDCSVCQERKLLSEFCTDKRNVRTGYRGECRACGTKQSSNARAKRDKAELNATHKEWRKGIRAEVVAGYGGQCQCCAELNIKFLTLDHVNDDGAEHRRTMTSATNIYLWARRNGYPDTLRLLCYNCNLGRAANGGVCPHKE
jgi:hypothetical protein